MAKKTSSAQNILNLNEKFFVRVAWSFEEKRTLHGQIVSVETDRTKLIKQFIAKERSQFGADKMKYCD